ncbi:amidohydrolase family protein [Dactylosporangium roseum]|uniref:Amidohydrolase family protein n=1 Tax=Dactylosporangium roseum TaxID=47989 RepID=A0ABY5Z020_9ACTN|nr:amidohydrolase family protein [Dactylosporangium roseum]UWZ34410.1 amidohydrolase family protein [Dactylosporangium roseum]
MSHLTLRDVEVNGEPEVDVRVENGTVVRIGPRLAGDDPDAVDGRGGALLPGLHDNHIHLMALAAALDSVDCRATTDADTFARLLRTAPRGGTLRVVGYDDSIAGPLDAAALDRMLPDRPVRVQYRTGGVWVLNSAALRRHPEVPRDGILVRGDALLRDGSAGFPDLARVARLLAAHGVTGVTDATPDLDGAAARHLAESHANGTLPQRLLLLGAGDADCPADLLGPRKMVIDEWNPPDLDAMAARIGQCHARGRNVAIHCTTRTETVLAVAALDRAGARAGDRLEHGGVIPREYDAWLRAHEVAVVTQPNFVAERGEEYVHRVDRDDLAVLYRARSLDTAGITVAGGTDAPFGGVDPWAAMAAAQHRSTSHGRCLGASERLTGARALALFTVDPLRLGRGRTVEPGAPADLCLLDRPLADALRQPGEVRVRATFVAGNRIPAQRLGGSRGPLPDRRAGR